MKFTMIDEYLGSSFKEVRNQRGLTMADVSQKIGIPLQTYACYEKGTRSMPQPIYEKACALLGLNPSVLMKDALDMYYNDYAKKTRTE